MNIYEYNKILTVRYIQPRLIKLRSDYTTQTVGTDLWKCQLRYQGEVFKLMEYGSKVVQIEEDSPLVPFITKFKQIEKDKSKLNHIIMHIARNFRSAYICQYICGDNDGEYLEDSRKVEADNYLESYPQVRPFLRRLKLMGDMSK